MRAPSAMVSGSFLVPYDVAGSLSERAASLPRSGSAPTTLSLGVAGVAQSLDEPGAHAAPPPTGHNDDVEVERRELFAEGGVARR